MSAGPPATGRPAGAPGAERAQREAASSLACLGGLVAGAAHDLNNPLAAVLGFAQLLLRRPDLAPEVRDDLTKISREAERAARLARALMIPARGGAGRRGPVDLSACAAEAASLHHYGYRAAGLTLELGLAPGLPPVTGDPGALALLVHHLLANAREAGAGAGRPVRVRLRTMEGPDGIVLEVQDDGPGVPDPLCARLFAPVPSAKRAGLGVGLAACAAIAADHGGTLRHDVPEGGGARFTCTVPRGAARSGA